MKTIPLRRRGVGVGCPYGKDPPLKAEAFFPLPRGDFHRRSASRTKGEIRDGGVRLEGD
jgi:hypothetical protein